MSKIKFSTSQKGVVGEYSIALYFVKKGYYVFMSLDPQSPADMVTMSPEGKLEAWDVKTNTFRNKNYKLSKRKIFRIPTDKQKKLGIKLIMTDFKE